MAPAARDSPAVVTSRDVDTLLRALGIPHKPLEAAIEDGDVLRRKVVGQWVFYSSEVSLSRAKAAIGRVAETRLRDWFLTPIPWLRGTIGKQLSGTEVSRGAVEPILRQLVSEGAFGVAGLLTQTFEPYFALFNLDDEPEVSRQLDFVIDLLSSRGAVRPRDLPLPASSRALDAWRGHFLRHAEFLGLGSVQASVLIAWGR